MIRVPMTIPEAISLKSDIFGYVHRNNKSCFYRLNGKLSFMSSALKPFYIFSLDVYSFNQARFLFCRHISVPHNFRHDSSIVILEEFSCKIILYPLGIRSSFVYEFSSPRIQLMRLIRSNFSRQFISDLCFPLDVFNLGFQASIPIPLNQFEPTDLCDVNQSNYLTQINATEHVHDNRDHQQISDVVQTDPKTHLRNNPANVDK